MTNDIYVYVVDMPFSVREAVMPCLCGYTVYLNAKLSRKGQEEAYKHAMWHIENNDFESEESVQTIEARAHGR